MKLKSESSLDAEGPSLSISWKDTGSIRVVWELTEGNKESIEQQFSIPLSELPFVVRLYDVTEREIKGDGLDQYVDFPINHAAPEWLLCGIEEGRSYSLELGVRMIDGRYYSLKRSNNL